MTKITKLCALALLSAALLPATASFAGAPLQLSLWAPRAQLVSALQGVTGLRLAIYGKNSYLKGLDIGGVLQTGTDEGGIVLGLYDKIGGDLTGASFGLVSDVGGDTLGITAAFINLHGGDLDGLTFGLYSSVGGTVTGLQAGMVNRASCLHGIQFGLFNFAYAGKGLQVGLLNYFDTSVVYDWLPLVNVAF